MFARGLAIALVLLSGCREARCAVPPADCLEVSVETRDAGGGVTAIRIASFESTCAEDLRLYCQIGVWDAALVEGTFRNFYFDTRTAGPTNDPFGREELFLEAGRSFGISCVSLSPDDADDVASCADASCGVPSAEQTTLDAASEADACRAGFFVPLTTTGD